MQLFKEAIISINAKNHIKINVLNDVELYFSNIECTLNFCRREFSRNLLSLLILFVFLITLIPNLQYRMNKTYRYIEIIATVCEFQSFKIIIYIFYIILIILTYTFQLQLFNVSKVRSF